MVEEREYVFYETLEDAIKNIKEDGRRLKFCSDELKNDSDLCMMAVKQNGLAIEFVPPRLKNNPNLLIEAVKQNSFAFCLMQDVFNNYKNNKEIIDKLNKLLAINIFKTDPNFDKHCDLRFSRMYKDKSWMNKAKEDYELYEHLKEWEEAGKPIDEIFNRSSNNFSYSQKKISQMEM